MRSFITHFGRLALRHYSSHCTNNMPCRVAGRAGALRPGRHVRLPNKQPAQVLATAMNAVGVPANGLGEVTGTILELFQSARHERRVNGVGALTTNTS